MKNADRAHARALLVIALFVTSVILLILAGGVAIVVGIIAAVSLR